MPFNTIGKKVLLGTETWQKLFSPQLLRTLYVARRRRKDFRRLPARRHIKPLGWTTPYSVPSVRVVLQYVYYFYVRSSLVTTTDALVVQKPGRRSFFTTTVIGLCNLRNTGGNSIPCSGQPRKESKVCFALDSQGFIKGR